MGLVYEAQDPVIHRRVAIKLVRADLLAGEQREDYVERFQREAQAAGRCSHPGIVVIYDFALHEGNPYLAMEYVEGLGLDRALRQEPRFTPAAAVAVILQVLEALGCAHALGIVHRDIKPANIVLMTGGQVKVMDFGIARLDDSDLTNVGTAIGTPSYMSPEQCRGDAIDARTDLFSSATVLQEMLIGQLPFPGRSFTQVAFGLMNEPPACAPELAAVAGPALTRVLHRALAKRPDERFADAAAMAAALRQALDGTPTATLSADSDKATVFLPAARGSGALPAPGSAAGPAAAGPVMAPALLGDLERGLARHLGPIARHLVHTSLRSAASAEDLCDQLARRIEHPDERRQFLSQALETVRTHASGQRAPDPGQTGAPGASAIAPEEIERARLALAKTLGPIARILVQRALGQARTTADLWDLLAVHLGSAAERADFLSRRDAGGRPRP